MHTKNSRSPRAGGVGTTLSLLLLGTLLTAAAAMFCYQQLKPTIEQDLTTGVTTALHSTGVTGVTVVGQDVFLSGDVGSEAVSNNAMQAAASVYGVSRVVNNLTVNGESVNGNNPVAEIAMAEESDKETKAVPAAELVLNNITPGTVAPSTLTIASNAGIINVQGIVSDDETISRINKALVGKFGAGNVKDGMSSFQGSEAPAWIDGMLSMIDQLDGIRNPILKVTGKDLVVAGTVNAEEIRRAKISAATRLLGDDLNIIDNLSIKEEAAVADQPADNTSATVVSKVNKRPASIEIFSTSGNITLNGFVANNDQADSVRNGLNDLFGQEYTDKLTVDDSVATANWIDEALSVTSELRDVNNFGVNVSTGQMLLTGSVSDRDAGRNLSITATEIAGSKLDILDNFSISNPIASGEEDLLAQSLMQELNALRTSNIIFNKNSTTLAPSAREVLDDVAAAILGYDDLVVEIAGHTDSSGDAVTNLKLSKERATAVRDYLVEKNVPASRLSPIGYGETTPISDNETSAGRAANRRIEFNL